MKRDNLYKLAQNSDEKLMIGKWLDKAEQAEKYDRIIATQFLDLSQQTLFSKIMAAAKAEKFILTGGYEAAERKTAVFLPGYWEESDLNEENLPFSALRLINRSKKELSHRDYLGALMSLGIRREMVGDILVSPEGADLLVMNEIMDFIISNLEKAANSSLLIHQITLTELMIPELKTKLIKDTVSSLRLDAVITVAFSMSRANAAEYIRKGLVQVNGAESSKPDMMVKQGDRLSLRGKGKAILSEVGGVSRKGRLMIEVKKLI